MARMARKSSESGVYHVMIRGINREKIFLEDDDKAKFLEIMAEVKAKTGYELYAYCLMDNHAHFLIKENDETISYVMKVLCGQYGAWFNYTHRRVGHVFQDRFKSECVETDAYFIAVLKYILRNPIQVGLAEDFGGYPWDSYKAYGSKKKGLTDVNFVLSLFDEKRKKAIVYFEQEMHQAYDGQFVRLTEENFRRSDSEAKFILEQAMKDYEFDEVGALSQEDLGRLIELIRSKGLTKRQIMGLIGISRRRLEKVGAI